MITSHGKLSEFLLYHKIVKPVSLRKLITEAQAIIVKAEVNNHGTAALLLKQADLHLVISVLYCTLLTPHRVPHLTKGAILHAADFKAVIERELVIFKQQPHTAVSHNRTSFITQRINRHATPINREVQRQIAVRRCKTLRKSRKNCAQKE